MPASSRLYHCGRCQAQVIVCSGCDRGQRYCAKGCADKARDSSLKRAAKRYRLSRRGRFNNADRQQRFRDREKQKVTHQGSLQLKPRDVLSNILKLTNNAANQTPTINRMCCHHCGRPIEPWLRFGFLQQSHFKRPFRR